MNYKINVKNRSKVEKLVYSVMNTLDPSGTNTERYKKLFSTMSDSKFDKRAVDEIVQRFLNREYEPNGKGGLFTVKKYERDLRTVEIWCQLNWYLDSIT